MKCLVETGSWLEERHIELGQLWSGGLTQLIEKCGLRGF